MPAKNPRRGRPKGSGLDDSGYLASIATLIDNDPNLKPTTAIKSLGISDPSTIRRLRDKYRKFKATSEIQKQEFDHQPKKSMASVDRARALKVATTSRPQTHVARQPRSPKPGSASADQLSEPASWLNTWTSLSLQTLSTTMEIQMAAMRNLIAYPPVAYAWRQQAAMNDFALSLYKNQKPLLVRFH